LRLKRWGNRGIEDIEEIEKHRILKRKSKNETKEVDKQEGMGDRRVRVKRWQERQKR
jgi:hypothetical protein